MAASKVPRTPDYTVAWIAAIGREFHAACTILDEEYSTPPPDLVDDDSTYTFGRIGIHNVVVAQLTSLGTVNASAQIANTARSFRKLRFALLVGIAGGAPSAKDDVRLGDIVVSYPNLEKNIGGVVDYHFGKNVQNQEFQRTGSLNGPPQVLLNAANKLKDDFTRKGCHITDTVNQIISKNRPHFDNFKRPGPGNDILYKPDFTHGSHAGDCNFPGKEEQIHLVVRKERTCHPEQPVIHHGIIGSADIVMKDASLRDKIAERDGCICFEMEAAGVMNNDLRCLVVRGICDYADSHKNKIWQDYAAAAAAVYAKELLNVVRSKAVTTRETALLPTAREVVPPRKQQDDSWGVAALLSYENMNDKRDYSLPGPLHDFEWAWSTPILDWLKESKDPYWISGKYASGKSTLIAYLADAKKTSQILSEEGDKYKIIAFYFDYRVSGKLANTLDGMLRMLLFQLADKSVESKKRLETLLTEGRLKVDLTQNLYDALCDALNASEYKFCIFVDGLDEYDGNPIELLQKLKSLTERAEIKLCLSSRPEARVSDVFQLHGPALMLQDHNAASMRSYTEKKILQVRSTNLDIEKQLPEELVEELVTKAEGILLWFALTVDELANQNRTDEEVHDFVKNVPNGLNAIYEQILGRIAVVHRPQAALILFLIRELRCLTAKDEFMGQSFSTTDLDHLWGAYDFILDQIGSEIGIKRLKDADELQKRTIDLLRGLVEFQDIQPEDHVFQGLTHQGVRYCHDTFDTFVHESSWIDDNLPEQFKSRYSAPATDLALQQQYGTDFWMRFFTAMIVQAEKDGILSPDQQAEAFVELELIMRPWYQEGLKTQGAPFRWLKAIFGKRSSSSMLLAILKEICPLVEEFWTQPDKLPQDNQWVKKAYQWLMSHSAPYNFPPQWKSRHVMLRTSFLLYLELAKTLEDNGASIFHVIAPAMQSSLNIGLIFGSFMLQSDLQERAVLKMSQNPELRNVVDLILTISHDISLYFDDRITRTALSSRQHEFVMQTILSRQNGYQLDVNEGFFKALKANGRLITSRDICSFLRDVWCVTAATTYTRYIFEFLDPITVPDTEAHAPDCKHHHKRPSLLLHWAKLSCRTHYCQCAFPVNDVSEDVSLEQPAVDAISLTTSPALPEDTYQGDAMRQATAAEYSTLLGLILACSQEKDINCTCYAGGTVLHAILDFNILYDSSIRGLDRKEKFLSLVDCGIDPKIESKHGDALTVAHEFKKKLRWKQRITPGWFESSAAIQDLMDIDFIIEHLEFYAKHGRWAKDEAGNFELISPAVDEKLDITVAHLKMQQEMDDVMDDGESGTLDLKKAKKSPGRRFFRLGSNASSHTHIDDEDAVSMIEDNEKTKKTPRIGFPRFRSSSNTPQLELPERTDSWATNNTEDEEKPSLTRSKAIGLGELMSEEQTRAFQDNDERLSADHTISKKSSFRDLLKKSPRVDSGDSHHSVENTPSISSLQATPSLDHEAETGKKSKRSSFFGGSKIFLSHQNLVAEEPHELDRHSVSSGEETEIIAKEGSLSLPVPERTQSTSSQVSIAVSDADAGETEAKEETNKENGKTVEAEPHDEKKSKRTSMLGGFKKKFGKEK